MVVENALSKFFLLNNRHLLHLFDTYTELQELAQEIAVYIVKGEW